MPPFRAPRGTSDILPDDQPYWAHATGLAADVATAFGYGRIDTPAFEDTGLFERGVGGDTDVVQKEMYTFQDHGGDSLTLKPEGTAPVCRAYIEHGMHNLPQPVRMYYITSQFRYERPQAGRFRQFGTFGVEAIGDPAPQVDAEVIELGWMFVTRLGLADMTLRVNSIGDPACRPAYLEVLESYYRERLELLCEDCKRRLERAPLRLLDCKTPSCQSLGDDAPKSADHLCDACAEHWTALQAILDGLRGAYPELIYSVDHRLVRGLDYYTRTVFEIEPAGGGGQSTVLGGGRYDGLIEAIGGPSTPGVGFGSGLDRLILNVKRAETFTPAPAAPDLVAIHIGDAALRRALSLAAELRAGGAAVVVAPAGRSMRAQMRYADALGARAALIIGERELARGVAALKPLDRPGEQVEIALEAAAVLSAVSAD